MTQIRGEQIKSGSIRDHHIAADAAISQSKISMESGEWISQGLVQVVTEDPTWDGSQEGQLYYNETIDTLRIGTSTEPYYSDLMGSMVGDGWDGEVNVIMGTEATDYDATPNTGTTFVLGISGSLATDGANLLVYLNGALMENSATGDYTIDASAKTIIFNYDIYGEDKVTGVLYSSASLTNYATKAYVQNSNAVINQTMLPDTDATYDIGSPSFRLNNLYAVDGHFSANTIYVGGGAIKYDTVNQRVQVSDDSGATFADVPKSAPAGEPAEFKSATGQKVVLESDTSIEIRGDILPDTTSSRDIGSDAFKFRAIYADEVFVSQNSLYVNNKKVLEDLSDTMTFSTDVDQAVQIKTTSTSNGTGNGNITLSSENLANVTALGGINMTVGSNASAKNIQFQNNSTDGHIEFVSNTGSGSGISFTGNTSFNNDLTIAGKLTVNGSTTTVNTTTVNIQDNLIQINSNQTGTPATSLIGGIEVNRGDSQAYRFVFEELTDTFKIGEQGSEQAVATREDTPTSNGLAFWNDVDNRLNTSADLAFDGTDLTVATRKVVTVSSGTSFPTGVGLGDECYRTDLDEWYKYNGSVWIQI